jgi:hypothetical protein
MLLCVVAGRPGLFADVATNSWSGHGSIYTWIGGNPDASSWNASVTVVSQTAPGAGGGFVVKANGGGQYVNNNVTLTAILRVGLNNGASTVYPGSNGTISIGGPGTYTIVVQWRDDPIGGSWNTVFPPNGEPQIKFAYEDKTKLTPQAANYDLHYRFYDKNGKLVADILVRAGDTTPIDVRTIGSDLTWQASLDGYDLDSSGNPVVSPGHNVIAARGRISDADSTTVGGAFDTPTQVSQANVDPTSGDGGGITNIYNNSPVTVVRQTLDNKGGEVATSTNTGGATGADVAQASNAIAQTVKNTGAKLDKSLAAIETAIKSQSGGGGGGSTDMTATNAKLDTANTKLGDIKANLDAIKTDSASISSLLHPANNAHEDPTADATAQVTAANGATNGAGVTTGGTPNKGWLTGALPTSGPSVTSSALPDDFVMDLGGQSLRVGVSETAMSGGASTVILALRGVLVLLLALMVGKKGGDLAMQYIIGMGNVDSGGANMAIENYVPGVAQAKQAIQATTVTGVMFGCSVALVGVVDLIINSMPESATTGGLHGLLNSFSISGWGAAPALINRFVPMATVVYTFIQLIAMPYQMAAVYSVAYTFVKYVKP